jgi:hypothetical protein
MNFFQIPDKDQDFSPKPIRSKKKVSLHPTFHVGSGIKQSQEYRTFSSDAGTVLNYLYGTGTHCTL